MCCADWGGGCRGIGAVGQTPAMWAATLQRCPDDAVTLTGDGMVRCLLDLLGWTGHEHVAHGALLAPGCGRRGNYVGVPASVDVGTLWACV